MNARNLTTGLVLLPVLALTGACGQKSPEAGAAAPTSFPAVRYEANVAAGGVAPPAGVLPTPKESSPNDVTSGGSLFSSMNCDGCHGGGATGWEGPSLVDGRWRYGGADDEIFMSIFYGRPKGMPAYG